MRAGFDMWCDFYFFYRFQVFPDFQIINFCSSRLLLVYFSSIVQRLKATLSRHWMRQRNLWIFILHRLMIMMRRRKRSWTMMSSPPMISSWLFTWLLSTLLAANKHKSQVQGHLQSIFGHTAFYSDGNDTHSCRHDFLLIKSLSNIAASLTYIHYMTAFQYSYWL